MTERTHPDLEILADVAAGETVAPGVAEHLRGCPVCRLEILRLRRFHALDADDEAADAAGWDGARFELERGWKERVLPALAEGADGDAQEVHGAAGTRRSTGAWRWLIPAAAAAALALLVWQPFGSDAPEGPSFRGPVRGGHETPAIELLAPSGELTAAPDSFRWSDAADHDSYRLEVFTPDLEILLRREGVVATVLAVPDSLRDALVEGGTYLWSITGFDGLTPAVTSPSAWFRVVASE